MRLSRKTRLYSWSCVVRKWTRAGGLIQFVHPSHCDVGEDAQCGFVYCELILLAL